MGRHFHRLVCSTTLGYKAFILPASQTQALAATSSYSSPSSDWWAGSAGHAFWFVWPGPGATPGSVHLLLFSSVTTGISWWKTSILIFQK